MDAAASSDVGYWDLSVNSTSYSRKLWGSKNLDQMASSPRLTFGCMFCLLWSKRSIPGQVHVLGLPNLGQKG
jgi:hypothetical protein